MILCCDEGAGHDRYQEFQINAYLSEDRTMLLPRTEKGKPRPLTSANLLKHNPVGMYLSYHEKWISLCHATTERDYYSCAYEDAGVSSLADFSRWVQQWCA